MGIYRINKLKITVGALLMAIAAILVAVSVLILMKWADFKSRCVSTDAVITDIRREYNYSNESTEYHVTVEYIVDGVVYRRPLGYYISSLREGQVVTINYDPEDPYFIMNDPFIACVLLAVFTLSCAGVGIYMLTSELLNRNMVNRLADESKYIICDGRCERIERNANITVNNVRYMQTDFIYYDMEGREYKFSSRAYHPDKCPFYPGQSVTIYVDIEKNPKKYYVHIDEFDK